MTLARTLQEAAGNGISTGSVVAEAIDFDGVNDYLSRASDLTGNADGKTFTFSAWVWVDASLTLPFSIYGSGSVVLAGVRFKIEATRVFSYSAYSAAGASLLSGYVNLSQLGIDKTWAHFLISLDMNNQAGRKVYINDINITSLIESNYSSSTDIDFTSVPHKIGDDYTSANKLKGRLSNVYLDYTYRDLSVTNNRRLFVTADLKPAAGQAALSPILYLPMDDPTQPGLNLGTGGNFTLTGTVARSGRGPNQYNAPYSDLDGTADYLSRTTAITGITNGKLFTLSFSFNLDAVGGLFFGLEYSLFKVRMGGPTHLTILAHSPALTPVLALDIEGVFTVGRNHHVVMSINMDSLSGSKIYVNGVDIAQTWGTFTVGETLEMTYAGTKTVGANEYLSDQINGRLGNVYFNTSYIDLSQPANLAKFVTGTGIDAKPVDLGANGELPTGSSPLIYLPMYGNNAGKNYGTGGDFTVNSGPFTGARGPNEFWGNKADFNGTTGTLSKTPGISGMTNGKTLSISFFGSFDATANSTKIFALNKSGSDWTYMQVVSGGFQMATYNSAGSGGVNCSASSIISTGTTAYCVQVCIDTSNQSNCKLFIDGVQKTLSFSLFTQDAILDFANMNTAASFGTASGAGTLDGRLSEFYFTTEYIDFSLEANRLKFRDAFGNPVDLGADGSTPTGTAPPLYMRFDPASFGTNSGTGGDFTVNGTITDGGQL